MTDEPKSEKSMDASGDALGDEISAEELAALTAQLGITMPASAEPAETLGDVISEEELAALQAALGGGSVKATPAPPKPAPPPPPAPSTAPPKNEPQLQELFETDDTETEENGLGLLLDVPLRVSVELGRISMTLQQVLTLGRGAIVELDRLAGEPVDILVNDKPIGRGEVVVVDEYFGVKITELIEPKG